MEDNVSSELPPLQSAMDVPPYPDDLSLSPLAELKADIVTYMSPLLLVVGSLGNVTSLIVLGRLSRKVLSTCFYLAVLCVDVLLPGRAVRRRASTWP